MNRQLNKTFKGKGPLARIPATEDETYPVTDESENFSIPDEPFNESEFVESLVGSGVERNEAEKLASYYLGNKKPEDDTDKKYSEIFDMLSQRYKKLQESGQVGE